MYLQVLCAWLASCTAVGLYTLVRRWIKQAHLREIPGPLRQSIWKGDLDMHLPYRECRFMLHRELGPVF